LPHRFDDPAIAAPRPVSAVDRLPRFGGARLRSVSLRVLEAPSSCNPVRSVGRDGDSTRLADNLLFRRSGLCYDLLPTASQNGRSEESVIRACSEIDRSRIVPASDAERQLNLPS
jgi:hypothetical protein